MEWTQQKEMERIAAGTHNGCLWNAAKRLWSRLPCPRPDPEDIFQECCCWAIEAVEEYVEGEATFFTWLNTHLGIRSRQYFNHSWLKRNTPENVGLYLSTDTGTEDLQPFYQDHLPNLLPDEQDQFLEFTRILSPRSRQLFKYFVDVLEWEDTNRKPRLLSCFREQEFIKRVRRYIPQLSVPELADFAREVRVFAPVYIDGFDFPNEDEEEEEDEA